MSEKNLEKKARVLLNAKEGAMGVVQLSRKIGMGPATLIALISEMEEEALIREEEAESASAGRPKKTLALTSLGEDYLSSYKALMLKGLRCRKSDLLRSCADAEYSARLVRRGVNEYDLFFELNEATRRA